MTSIAEPQRIPEMPPDSTNLDHAQALADNGIYVVPVKPGTKHAAFDGWQSKSSRDPKTLVAWFAGTSQGIAIDCGRSGLVVIDVDKPALLPQRVAGALKASDAPRQTTRPDTPAERISVPAATGTPDRLQRRQPQRLRF